VTRWRLLGVGLGAYAMSLIATAPATLIDAVLKETSNGRLRLAEAQGTIWSGAGQIEIRDADARNGVAKNLEWRVLPESLLRGHLVCEVVLDQTAKPFQVALSLSRLELAETDIDLPAAVLSVAAPKLAPLRLTGNARLHIATLALGRSDVRGIATLQWLAAGSALTPVSPLGDYELRIEGDGIAVHASLRTLRGPLQLDGSGAWTQGRNPVFHATARVPLQQQQQLAPLLRLIAVERSEGFFELELK
jgi:general secretion pathway protein N